MTVLARPPFATITATIGISLLVHAFVLLAPAIHLPQDEPALSPPLVAKLEPLPATAARPASPAPGKPRPRLDHARKKAPPPVYQHAATPAEPDPAPEEPGIQDEHETPVSDPIPAAENRQPAHPLPRHALLNFTAHLGTGYEIGEALHRFDIAEDGNYTLHVAMKTTGLAGFIKRFESSQQSTGKVNENGLIPTKYKETKLTSEGSETVEATFPPPTHHEADSEKTILDQIQDITSFLYQLSQLPLDRGLIPVHINNGKRTERYDLAIGEEEIIETPMGKLRALPLRKLHLEGEEGLEVWLALEYRLLPVKIRQIGRDGKIAGEMIISDIRASDE